MHNLNRSSSTTTDSIPNPTGHIAADPNLDDDNDSALGDDIHHKLYLAPLQNPQRVLDVGTGTGIWAIDFANEFPGVEFKVDDASQDWTFPDSTFDYIHIRFMAGCFKVWTNLYSECFRFLKPGGWLEHQERGFRVFSDDGSILPDTVLNEAASSVCRDLH
ncbi:S-adenosylmethionine-dependent methyltransferase [Metarhizium rileyi]|uniref:S-adenosylmethionine-dependent methyltransferase n=1 Tax=Metarhizium rileyi (strain RCEF 4871) TaxID=1649241 RepID=A0A166X0W6_METRR|nr:S-adenosylmethionine-dependent methyltransferase [Metarhizium rileyi RCEF 4871]